MNPPLKKAQFHSTVSCLAAAEWVVLLVHGSQIPQQPSRTPGRKLIDDAPADVVTSAKVMILVQLLKIAIRRPDGIHADRYGVHGYFYPLSGRKEFKCLTLSLVEDHSPSLTLPDPAPDHWIRDTRPTVSNPWSSRGPWKRRVLKSSAKADHFFFNHLRQIATVQRRLFFRSCCRCAQDCAHAAGLERRELRLRYR